MVVFNQNEWDLEDEEMIEDIKELVEPYGDRRQTRFIGTDINKEAKKRLKMLTYR